MAAPAAAAAAGSSSDDDTGFHRKRKGAASARRKARKVAGEAATTTSASTAAASDGDDFGDKETSDADGAATGSGDGAGGTGEGASPEGGSARKKRKANATGKRPAKARGGVRYSEGMVADATGEVVDSGDAGAAAAGDASTANPHAAEARMLEAFVSAGTGATGPAKHKVLVTRTYMDERGYLVTHNVWEEAAEGAVVEAEAEGPAPAADAAGGIIAAAAPSPPHKSAAAVKRAPSATGSSGGTKSAAKGAPALGTGGGKQTGLASFFGKKA